MSFIKDSMKEFDHIVWPTASETKKYFVTVVGMITILTILLFIVGTALSAGLFGLKSQVTPIVTQSTSTASPNLNLGDLKLDATTGTPTADTKATTTTTAPVTPKK